jgi:NAD(P)H-hydrate epimerase
MMKTLTTLLNKEANTMNWLDRSAIESLTHKVFSAEQVRENEAAAATAASCSMYQLMQRAGEAVFKQLSARWPKARRILVVVGHGNNGGDGYIVSFLARQNGLDVVLCCADTSRLPTGDALTAQQQWLKEGGQLASWQEVEFADFDVIVDGLLGTGINGKVQEPYQSIIGAINDSPAAALSIDLPSGLNADKGYPMGCAVNADCTVTFVGIKSGLVTAKGKECAGELIFDELGIGAEFSTLVTAHARLVNYGVLMPLPPRALNEHKGTNGKLLCIGGSTGMPGAIRMSGEAALRSGAGLVKAFCHPSSELQVITGRPELMLATRHIGKQLGWATCFAIGPGLGQDDWGLELFDTLRQHLISHPKPVVIDADGLNLLASRPEWIDSIRPAVITPHPGEAARLLDCKIDDIENNRFFSANKLAKQYQTCCVLKGAGTIVSDGSQSIVCTDGNPGMATGGMGDVLTGITAALLAQGIPAFQAAVYAVCLHANAADKVAAESGQRGMLATDLFEPLRKLVNWA